LNEKGLKHVPDQPVLVYVLFIRVDIIQVSKRAKNTRFYEFLPFFERQILRTDVICLWFAADCWEKRSDVCFGE